MPQNMYLNFFCRDKDFPFYIQYGRHNDPMFLHGHADFSELVIILGGSATHMVNGEEHFLKKGDVFIINEDTIHGYKNTNHFRICNIMFQPSYFFTTLGDLKELPGFHALFVINPAVTEQKCKTSVLHCKNCKAILVDAPPHFEQFPIQEQKGVQECLSLSEKDFEEVNKIMIQLHQEYTTHSSGYKTMVTSLFLQMVTVLSRLYTTSAMPKDQNIVSLANPLAYIQQHFREEISIESLAKMTNMSARHFRRIFHDIYHTSPLKYINSLRIQYAKNLLISTELSITEISIQCGFSDANYFSAKFKKATGQSPAAFRKGN